MSFLDPFAALQRLQQAVESSMSPHGVGSSTGGGGAYPPVNVFQRGDDFVIFAELPGVDKQALNIQIHRNQVRIAGHRDVGDAAGTSVHRRERQSGEFDRTLTLPITIDPDAARARHEAGILRLTLSRADADKPRTIEVA